VTKVRDNAFLKRFGSNLKRLRELKGLSQEELHFRAQVSFNQIGSIERGEINTTINTVYAIAQALDVDVRELFALDEA
jgi:transcriptional regulator with XRE-family HTH domain